jgi:hypothetical protein
MNSNSRERTNQTGYEPSSINPPGSLLPPRLNSISHLAAHIGQEGKRENESMISSNRNYDLSTRNHSKPNIRSFGREISNIPDAGNKNSFRKQDIKVSLHS